MLGSRVIICCLIVLSLAAHPSSIEAHKAASESLVETDAQIQANPGDARLYLHRAMLYTRLGDHRAALEDLGRAAELDAGLPLLELLRAEAYLELGRFDDAEASLRIELERSPRSGRVLVVWARLEHARGKLEEAARSYSRAIAETERPSPDWFLGRARVLRDANQLDRAIRGLDEGIRTNGSIALELEAIQFELDQGRPERAIARLDRIVERSERKDGWLARRAAILEATGQLDLARRDYARALSALEALPPSRRASRAMHRLAAELEAARDRLDAPEGGEVAP